MTDDRQRTHRPPPCAGRTPTGPASSPGTPTGRYDATKFTHDEAGEERIVDDVGFGDRRITTVEELAAQMNRTLPAEVVHDLQTGSKAPNQLA